MKQFKFILLLLIAATALQAQAETYGYLTFQAADGSLKSVPVSALSLSYADGQLTAASSTATATFATAQLAKMYFSTTSAGISTVISDLTADEGPVVVFNLTGAQVGTFSTAAAAQSSLTPDIYVIKSQTRTIKALVK